MKTKLLTIVSLLLFSCGCSVQTTTETGFLSDYSKLRKDSNSSMRYVDKTALAKYSSFIVDPVKVYFPPESKSKGKLTHDQIADVTNYLHTKIVEAVNAAGKKIAYRPASGVARIRIALTDIVKTSVVNDLPDASLLGVGIGGASIEAEIVDSITYQQLDAVVQSGKGSRIPFTNLGNLNAAKKVIDAWAAKFQKHLEQLP